MEARFIRHIFKHTPKQLMQKKKVKSNPITAYLYQFLVVVAGIVVTFIGSGIITHCSEQSDIKALMQLVIEELNQNKEHMKDVERRMSYDRTMSIYLIDSNYQSELFPVDTLIKYRGLIGNIANLRYTRDAMELLQSSALIQKIDNKTFMLEIIRMYDNLEQTSKTVDLYYNLKLKTFDAINSRLDENEQRIISEKRLLPYYQLMMSKREMRTFCIQTHDFITEDYFELVQKDISKLTTSIKQEYGLQ